MTAASERRRLSAYVESWGVLFDREGLPRASGRIWGWLLVCAPPEQSTGQLCEALGLTKGSISTSTRLLERAGLLERLGVKGARQIHYRIRPDAYERLMQAKLDTIGHWKAQADVGLELLEGTGSDRTRRLRELREFYAFIGREHRALQQRWRRRRTPRGAR